MVDQRDNGLDIPPTTQIREVIALANRNRYCGAIVQLEHWPISHKANSGLIGEQPLDFGNEHCLQVPPTRLF